MLAYAALCIREHHADEHPFVYLSFPPSTGCVCKRDGRRLANPIPSPDDDFKGLATWHELIITPAGCRRGPVERGRRHWVLGRGPVDRGGEVRLGKAYGIAHRDWAAANTADSRFAIASVIRA